MAPASLGSAVNRLRSLAAGRTGSEPDDAQLLHAFAVRNDQAAFASLVRRHGPLVFGVCRNILRHEQDAEDAFQATFLTLARRAGSIRSGEALAGWLHSVARRTALKAHRAAQRRQTHEGRASAPVPQNTAWDVAWREVQAVLDEEVQRLPAIYRDVFVLCCMEGCGRAEAARQLGVKEGTVASRLAKARQRLQERLTRRGLVLSAVLAACSLSRQASAARAAELLRSAVAAVSTLTPTARVAALLPLRGPARFKVIGGLLLTLGLFAAGVGVLAQQQAPQAAAPPPPAPKKEERHPAASLPAIVEQGDSVTISGRVLDPEGKPLAGADVCLGWYRGYPLRWWPWTVEPLRPARGGKSRPDGSFSFTLTKKELYAAMRTSTTHPWRGVQVVATARGYAPGWRYIEPKDRGLTVRLVRDDAPIKGKVVDLQGRPVIGARVWLGHITAGSNFLTVNAGPGLPAAVRTDREGLFVVTGVGRGRKVLLHVAGPSIEHKSFEAKPGGKAVEMIVGPTKPVEGTVLALDSGKPLAGVVVFGDHRRHRGAVHAVTDARGHYRLIGLPKQSHYELTFQPVGKPYLSAVRLVAGSEGLKPLSLGCRLRRGVRVRFQLIDRETRKPVRARVQYTPLKPNPLYREVDPEGRGITPNRVFEEIHTADGDQFYDFMTYPGPGVLIVFGWESGRNYLGARFTTAEKKKGLDRIDPHLMFVDLAVGYRFLDLAPSETPVTLSIELDPGRTVSGTLLGPDGKPVTGATACGLTYHPHHRRTSNFSISREQQALPGSAFTAVGLDTQAPRTVAFVHRARKLIGKATLKGDEKSPVVVRLQPWGELTGRLVDPAGKPLANVGLWLRYPPLPAPGLAPLERIVRTDGQGRFRIEGLLPGLEHAITLRGEKKDVQLSAGAALRKLVAASGEVKDLGNVRVTVASVPRKGKGAK